MGKVGRKLNAVRLLSPCRLFIWCLRFERPPPSYMVHTFLTFFYVQPRSVRESASYAGDGFQLSQTKDIVKIGKDVLDLKGGQGQELAALTPTIVQSLQLGIDCYKAKVDAIQEKLRKAEAWMVQAKDVMARDAIKMEEIEALLKAAHEVGVENEDLAKKIRAELGRCKSWMGRADVALTGSSKPTASAVKKLLAEGEKIKVIECTFCSSGLARFSIDGAAI